MACAGRKEIWIHRQSIDKVRTNALQILAVQRCLIFAPPSHLQAHCVRALMQGMAERHHCRLAQPLSWTHYHQVGCTLIPWSIAEESASLLFLFKVYLKMQCKLLYR